MERGARRGAGGGRGGGGRGGTVDLTFAVRGRRVPALSMTTGAVVGRVNSMSVEIDPLARSGPDVGARCLERISCSGPLDENDRFTLVTMSFWRYSVGRHCCSNDDANARRRLLRVRWEVVCSHLGSVLSLTGKGSKFSLH